MTTFQKYLQKLTTFRTALRNAEKRSILLPNREVSVLFGKKLLI